ncbi:hypothetical protein LCM10_19855 [Rossellomorea aquimaris]|uniref:hypothetical protein n=1 Tax=Rossellomorea aquimaris TaxID=189382 RepID=UPI001CD34965|nr:hypothetical protein [Rossellomorea aquimaris]MCA1057203.1 hypothetical protein [Rossellomorea aquimaris]
MNYYVNVIFTIVLLILLTLVAFAINHINSYLHKKISQKYLTGTIIFILLLLMTSGSYMISILGSWTFMDTIFVTSMCFFGIGWITNITQRANLNTEGTIAKFITNNAYKHQYEAASSSGMNVYFIASLLFLTGSWGTAFLAAFL